MIYLKDGNIPLNLAYDDDIVQDANSTYQLSFKFPLTDGKWNLLKREVFLLADDLHGEQEFFIFEVKKAKGYVQVYAKQVATLLNYYSINSISVDRVPGQTVMTALAGSVKRPCPFTFFSDIMDRHTFNESDVSVMNALVKEKHSILGQWGGDLVRDKYQVKLLKNGGIENESLFMYKKNLNNYEETENINSLKTRLHLKKVIKGQSEGEEDRVLAVTVDSSLINQYNQIYEADIEVNDQDVTDVASLTAYGKRYFSSTLCDLVENSIHLDVKGKADVAVKMFDTVSVFHERFGVDVRLKITSYHFGPMSKRLKSIGFGKVSQSFGSTVASMVAGSVDKATGTLSASFEQKLQKEIDNANRHFDTEFEKRKRSIEDGIEQAQAEAERYADNIKQEITTEIAQVNASMQAQAEEHDRQVADILGRTGANADLANVAKQLAERAQVNLDRTRSSLESLIGQANTKAGQLEQSVGTIRADLTSQARSILAQAQAQTALTNRVTTVETLADGTETIVAELSKTVSKATGDIASVTSRTKTVEDTLSQTRTQYEALTQTVDAQTGQIDSINRKTADLQSGIDGVTERFENIKIGSKNYIKNASFLSGTLNWVQEVDSNLAYNLDHSLESKGKVGIHMYSRPGTALIGRWKGIRQDFKIQQPANTEYALSLYLAKDGVGTDAEIAVHFMKNNEIKQQAWFKVNKADIPTTYKRFIFKAKSNFDVDKINVMIYVGPNAVANLYVTDVQLEVGNIASDFHLSEEDLRSEFATYKRTAEEASNELSRQIQLTDGKAIEAKTYAQQTAERLSSRLESLETYKDGESTRASQYFTASRDETARQVSALRTVVTNDYVAKSTFEENARGVAQRFEQLKVSHRNLAQGTSDRWNSFISIDSSTNWLCSLAHIDFGDITGIYAGSRIHLYVHISADDIRLSGNGAIALQGRTLDTRGNWTWTDWNRYYPLVNKWRSGLSVGNNYRVVRVSATVTEEMYRNSKGFEIGFRIDGVQSGKFHWRALMVSTGDVAPDIWSPAPEDQHSYADTKIAEYKNTVDGQFTNLQKAINGKVSRADFQHVQTTSQLYERIIGSTESGVKDKIARMVMADSLFTTEVKDKISGTATQVSQLAGSYAIKNLTSSGKVLNQLNLNKDGSVKIDGSLVQITGRTYIQDGVIASAKIASLDAGKITSGYLDAARIRAGAIDGSKIAFDEAFFNGLTANQAYLKKLFAKDAFITSVQAVSLSASQIVSGVLRAMDGAMDINLNDASMVFREDAKIEFQSENNTLYRTKNGTSAFIHFRDDTYNGVYTAMGVNADNTGTQNDYSSGAFAGVRVIRTNPNRYSGTTVDEVQLVGDTINMRHAFGSANDYLRIKWDGGSRIDLIQFLRAVSNRLGIALA